MSEGIAPLPNGMAISVVAEQGPRPDRDPRQTRGEQSHDSGRDAPAPEADNRPAPRDLAAAPSLDDPGLPAATLFITALIANQMDLIAPSGDELKLRAGHGWTPPDSPLRLKDKLI